MDLPLFMILVAALLLAAILAVYLPYRKRQKALEEYLRQLRDQPGSETPLTGSYRPKTLWEEEEEDEI